MLVAENLKIREVYTSWLRGKLREWYEESPAEHRVSATLLFMDDEVHRMADRLESLFTHSLATMAIYGWLAQNEYAGRLSEWLGSEFIKELPDPLMRAICRHAQWLCRLDGDRNLVPLLARLCEIKATTRPDRDFLRSMGVSNKMLTRFRKVPVKAVKGVVSHLPDAPDGAKRYLRQWADVLKLADLSKPDASLNSWKPHPLLPSLCQLLAHLERPSPGSQKTTGRKENAYGQSRLNAAVRQPEPLQQKYFWTQAVGFEDRRLSYLQDETGLLLQ